MKDLQENSEALANHFLVPPSTKPQLDSMLSQEKIKKIKAKVEMKSARLAEE